MDGWMTYYMYSVLLWIPPVAFPIKATEVTFFKAENYGILQFKDMLRNNETGGVQSNTLCAYEKTKKIFQDFFLRS